jgi:pyruvate dehydrogenase E2 component (dihydrolipoamide acetyltransferase)
MAQSNAQIPQYFVSQTVDLAASLAWLAEHNAGLPAAKRVLSAAVLLRATMLAATAVPDLNAHWVNGRAQRAQHVDVGVTVATRAGELVTPALTDVGEMRIDDLMAAFRDLVHRARRGALRRSEMAGASITMSSVGETGPDGVAGAVVAPQVALVGVGGIVQAPPAVNGLITAHPSVTITLAADHRATDGRSAAAFVSRLDRALQNPQEL